jgi:hypothetical protein
MGLTQNPNGPQGPEDKNRAPEGAEAPSVDDLDKVQSGVDDLRNNAFEAQQSSADAVIGNTQKIVDTIIDAAGEDGKDAALQTVTAKLDEMGISYTLGQDGEIVVAAIATEVKDASGIDVAKEDMQKLAALDMSPGDRADIRKALSQMSAAEITEVSDEAGALYARLGRDDVAKLVSFYNETDSAKIAVLRTELEAKIDKTLLDNGAIKKFFKVMDAPAPAAAGSGEAMMDSLNSLGDQLKPGLEQLMAALKKFKLMIDDFSAKMNGDERITDSGILEDITSGDMPKGRSDIYKKKAFDKWKTVDSEIKKIDGIPPGTPGSMDKAVKELGDPAKTPEEREVLLQKLNSLREQREDLIKKRTVLKQRFDALGADPADMIKEEKEEAEKKEKEAKAKEAAENLEKTEKAESAVKTINNVPKNDFVNALYTEANGLRLAPKGAQKFNDKLAAKLKALPGAIVKTAAGKDTVYTTDISPENITRVVDIIKGEAVRIIDDNTVLKANEKKGLKAALAANGEWTEPISSPAGNQYHYIQAKNGTVYAQNVDGSSTWEFNGDDFVKTEDKYFSGELGDLVKKPSDTSSMTYDTETKTWVAMSKEAKEAQRVAIKTTGETYIKGRSDYSSTYGGDGHIINIAWDVDDVVFGFEDGEWVWAEQNDWDKGTRLSLSTKPGSSGNDYWSDNGISVINKALSKLKKINKGEAV